jgi:hypothetical protein
MARSARPSVADLGGRRRANAAPTPGRSAAKCVGGPSGHHQGVSTVVMHTVASVDGFVADAGGDVGPLFEWYLNGDAEIVDGGPFTATEASLGYVRPMWERVDAQHADPPGADQRRFQPRPRSRLTRAAADGGGSPR